MLFFWLPLCLLGAGLYLGLLEGFSSLPPERTGASNDIATYQKAGEAILAGDVPYRDFFIEYPPGSLPAFVPPALFTTQVEDYATLFASEMALVLVAALGFTALAARSWGRHWLFPATVFAAGALLLYPIAITRYDAIIALATAATSLSVSGLTRKGAGALAAAWFSLGFGAAAKLVPALATLPLALLTSWREGERRFAGVTWGFAVFFLVVAAFFLPAYLLGGADFVESFAYHAERGLQVESLPASALMQLGWLESVSFEYGAFEVQGRGVELLTSASLPVTGALLAVTAVVMLREYRAGRFGSEQFPRFAAAFLLAFLLGSKVLSPQYVIWLLPLLPLSAVGVWGLGASGIFLATCWMTSWIYDYHYDELINLQPPATGLLLIRNLLLAVLWTLMLSLPSSDRKVEPAEQGEPA